MGAVVKNTLLVFAVPATAVPRPVPRKRIEPLLAARFNVAPVKVADCPAPGRRVSEPPSALTFTAPTISEVAAAAAPSSRKSPPLKPTAAVSLSRLPVATVL